MPDAALGWIVPEPEPAWRPAVRRMFGGLVAEALEAAIGTSPVRYVVDIPDGPGGGPLFEVAYDDDLVWETPAGGIGAAALIDAARAAMLDSCDGALRRAKRAADALWAPLDLDGPCELPCCAADRR